MASYIRSIRSPEPYKGKGIRYQGEVVVRFVEYDKNFTIYCIITHLYKTMCYAYNLRIKNSYADYIKLSL